MARKQNQESLQMRMVIMIFRAIRVQVYVQVIEYAESESINNKRRL